MLLRELSETALLLLFSLDCCGPTTITTSSDDTSDCLVGVAYGLGGGREERGWSREEAGRWREERGGRRERVWKGGGEEKGTYHVSYRRKV